MDPKNPDEVGLLLPKTPEQTLKIKEKTEPVPQPMEGKTPRPAESTIKQADEHAITQRATGPMGMPGSTRPAPPETKHEEGSVIVAKHLAPQLATDPSILANGYWDERKMMVIKDGILPPITHFSARFTYDGVRYWGHLVEWILIGSQGVDGRGRRDILAAIGASTGAQSIEKAQAPNVIARNLWSRNWKEKAASEGKVVD